MYTASPEGGFVYLASPYSHKSKRVMMERFIAACDAAASLMASGLTVFSPIAHSHPLADFMAEELRTDFEFWMGQDIPILSVAREMVVLTLDGWRESRGVTRELAIARAHGKPVRFYHPELKAFHDPSH